MKRNFRSKVKNSKISTAKNSRITLKIQIVYKSFNIYTILNFSMHEKKLILIENVFNFLSKKFVKFFCFDVMLNYFYQNRIKDVNQQ